MSKKDLNKAVGNAFEDLKDEEMAKTQGAGDTEAETITTPLIIEYSQKLIDVLKR